MINAKAFVKQGQLIIIGFYPCDLGIVPFVYQRPVPESIPDGPVNIGAENLDPEIGKALDESERPIMATIQHEQMKLAAQSLVTRARCGDQNAMGMITMVGQQAKNGKNQRAVRAFALLQDYIRRNPIKDGQSPCKLSSSEIRIAGEIRKNPAPSTIAALIPAIKNGRCGAIILANSKEITKLMLSEIQASFATRSEQDAFSMGYRLGANAKAKTPQERQAIKVGYCVSLARRLQAVRRGAPISAYCPNAAWELGE